MEHTVQDNIQSKPDQVKTAVNLLYASLAIGVLNLILSLAAIVEQSLVVFVIVVAVITISILFFLIVMISSGKNWARIVFLILYVIGLPGQVATVLQLMTAYSFISLTGTVQTILQLVAIVLLFQSASTAWFKRDNSSNGGN